MSSDSPQSVGSSTTDRSHRRETARKGVLPTLVVAVLVGASLLWFGVAAATAFGTHLPANPFASPAKGSGSNGPGHVYLTIAFNPANGYDEYFPANFTVPANTPVVFEIQSWDDGVNNVSPMYLHVAGTQNGVITYNDGMGDPTQTLTSVAPDAISHTFTVMTMGSDSGTGGMPMLNVPIPAVQNLSDPVTVTFTATFSQTGAFTWMCFAPCDPSSMGTPGYMSGTITVA